jgi:hypothetical protein
MNEHDKNFIKNMSPLLITALVMFLMMVAFDSKADDHNIIGHTEHGIAITEDDIKQPVPYVGNIINAVHIDPNIIRVKMRNKDVYDLHTNSCWDLDFATGYIFGRQNMTKHFNRIEPGLRIFTVSFGKIQSNYCYVTKVTMVAGVG